MKKFLIESSEKQLVAARIRSLFMSILKKKHSACSSKRAAAQAAKDLVAGEAKLVPYETAIAGVKEYESKKHFLDEEAATKLAAAKAQFDPAPGTARLVRQLDAEVEAQLTAGGKAERV